jgi:ketosteroid isomerase-like protein
MANQSGEATTGVEVARLMYEAFGRGDIPAVLALFEEALEWREAEGNPYRPDGAPWVGAKTVLTELFGRLAVEWDGFTVTPKTITETATGAVAECRYTGTYKATGRRLDAQVCHVLRIRQGRLTHFQQYVDTATMQWVMGFTPSREGSTS